VISDGIHWSVDSLLGPVDVYLIVAVQVKSNFCRKFVVEPGHTLQTFIILWIQCFLKIMHKYWCLWFI